MRIGELVIVDVTDRSALVHVVLRVSVESPALHWRSFRIFPDRAGSLVQSDRKPRRRIPRGTDIFLETLQTLRLQFSDILGENTVLVLLCC